MQTTYTFKGANGKGDAATATFDIEIIPRGCSESQMVDLAESRGNYALIHLLISLGEERLSTELNHLVKITKMIFDMNSKKDEFEVKSIALKKYRSL